jgi:N-acetylmuramoyl-L-alanine amidase
MTPPDARPRHLRPLIAGAALTILALTAIAAWVAVASQPGGDSHSLAMSPRATGHDRPAAPHPATSPAPTPLPQPLAGKVVAVDPGHNGGNASHPAEINRSVDIGNGRKACDTAGAATAAGYTESAYNLDVGLRLRRLLREMGAKVVMTRTTDTGVGLCINKRAQIGNRAHADAAISIHADGGPTSGRGFHVIYPAAIPGLTDDIAAASKQLALAVRAAYQQGTRMPRANYIGHDGLDRRGDLGGLNLSDVPKVFIETGNMNNPTDAAHLERPPFRQRVAKAIANGIEHYLAG